MTFAVDLALKAHFLSIYKIIVVAVVLVVVRVVVFVRFSQFIVSCVQQ